MSTPGAEPPAPASAPAARSGIQSALRYTGLPASWFTKRPKLPSRNWLIFLGITSSLASFYAYDRRQCKVIRESYVKRVEHLAQQPMGSMELPRKVSVYTSKWPGDDDHLRALRYFRKYVKPILNAAAVDYEVLSGKRHGDLTRELSDRIKAQRRIELGLEPTSSSIVPTPIKLSKEEETARALAGGSVIIGRMSFKEYMEGLRRGWTESPERVDREEMLAHVLENDGNFDEPELADPASEIKGEPIPTKSRLLSTQNVQTFSPLQLPSASHSSPAPPVNSLPVNIPPPSVIPPQPPLLLVPFTNRIGLKQIPLMIVDFFNQRSKVRAGAEAAYRLVMARTRPFSDPLSLSPSLHSPDGSPSETDLDFDRLGESHYQSFLSSFLQTIEKAREEHYAALPARLATARALSRGEREPTKEEKNHPPPTEVELRAERMKKELRWRKDEEGWGIVGPEKDVAWDERFRGALKVFVDPREDSSIPSQWQ